MDKQGFLSQNINQIDRGRTDIENAEIIGLQSERTGLAYDYGYNLRTDEQRLNYDTLTIETTKTLHSGIDPVLLTKKSYKYDPRTGTIK